MSGYFPDEGGWSPGDAEPMEGLVIGEALNVPERVVLPKPKLWIQIPMVILMVVGSQFTLHLATRRAGPSAALWVMLGFMAGCAWLGAVYLAGACFVHYKTVKARQAELDEMHEKLRVRVAMVPPLVNRYGPESAMRLLQMAEDLVGEGDFDDIRAAVASIERHHDLEPTVFADKSA